MCIRDSNTNGGFVYTPSTNYVGPDSFTYRANDGRTNSSLATVTLTVRTPNNPPTVTISSPTNGAFYVAPASLTVVAEAADSDGAVTNIALFRGTNPVS